MSLLTVVSFVACTLFSSWVCWHTLLIPQPEDTRSDKVIVAVLLGVVMALCWFLAYRIAGRIL